MNSTRAAIVEDEIPTARRLCSMVQTLRPEWTVEVISGSISGARKWFAANAQPDILFLDINLSDGSIFELIEQVKPTGLIVFTTAYDEYAVQAFSVNSVDYLLKPVKSERLADAIAKFERLSPQQLDVQNQAILETLETLATPTSSRVFRSRFLIAKGSEMHIVYVSDIAFFYTQERGTYAVTFKNQRYMLGMRLENMMEELDPELFFRTNRQTIVNIHAITKIESYFHNSVVVHTNPLFEEKITVSKEKLTAFKLWLNR